MAITVSVQVALLAKYICSTTVKDEHWPFKTMLC